MSSWSQRAVALTVGACACASAAVAHAAVVTVPAPTFAPPALYDQSVGAGQGASFTTVADVNGDGKPDLVTVENGGVPAATVRLGRGDGGFGPIAGSIPLAAGSNPHGVVVADFNGDGKPDIAVALNSTTVALRGIAIALGNGDGTFQAPTVIADAAAPYELAAADLNGDGKLDLVDTGSVFSTVSVRLGNGNGTFQPPTVLPADASPYGLAVGDVNGDGRPDLVVATLTAGPSSGLDVYPGLGGGAFGPRQSIPLGSVRRAHVALADLRRNGRLDIISSGGGDSTGAPNANTIGVLLGNGDGSFAPQQQYTVDSPGGTAGIVSSVGDLDGDGTPDIAVSADGDKRVRILLGNGDGTFRDFGEIGSNVSGAVAESTLAADLNGDGKTDIVTIADTPATANLVLLNTTVPSASAGPLTFGGQVVGTTATQIETIANVSGDRFEPLQFGGLAIAGANAGDFAITTIGLCPVGVLSGGACQLQVAFTPTAVGARSAALRIASNDPASPLSIPIAGVGLAPPPPPPPPAPPAPVLGHSVVIHTVSGQVLVRLRGSAPFTALEGLESIPVGTVIDARQGRVRLCSVSNLRGAIRCGDFYRGEFEVLQAAHGNPVTVLQLAGGSFAHCHRASRRGRGAARSPGAEPARGRRSQRRVRALWGDAHGNFVTLGHDGSAAVRGTLWVTADRCDGTLVIVHRGLVRVRDFHRHRTVRVRSGQRYLARR